MSGLAPPAFTFKAPQTALYEVAIKTVSGGITPKRLGEESNAERSQLIALSVLRMLKVPNDAVG